MPELTKKDVMDGRTYGTTLIIGKLRFSKNGRIFYVNYPVNFNLHKIRFTIFRNVHINLSSIVLSLKIPAEPVTVSFHFESENGNIKKKSNM